MKYISTFDQDLWKDVVARCIAADISPKAAAKMADEACDEYRKRLAPNDKALIEEHEAKEEVDD